MNLFQAVCIMHKDIAKRNYNLSGTYNLSFLKQSSRGAKVVDSNIRNMERFGRVHSHIGHINQSGLKEQ